MWLNTINPHFQSSLLYTVRSCHRESFSKVTLALLRASSTQQWWGEGRPPQQSGLQSKACLLSAALLLTAPTWWELVRKEQRKQKTLKRPCFCIPQLTLSATISKHKNIGTWLNSRWFWGPLQASTTKMEYFVELILKPLCKGSIHARKKAQD